MNTPAIRVPNIQVPSLQGDNALQELRRRVQEQMNAGQELTPPTSAVEFTDRIAENYFDRPMARERARTMSRYGKLEETLFGTTSPQALQPRNNAREEQDERMRNRLEAFRTPEGRNLLTILQGIPGMIGAAVGPGLESQRLTEEESEEAKAEAVRDYNEELAKTQRDVERSQRIRAAADLNAADLGFPGSTGVDDPHDLDLLRQENEKNDAERIKRAEENLAGAIAAPGPQMPRWVNALRGSFQGIHGLSMEAARGAAYLLAEAAPDLLVGGTEAGRSELRAWVDAVDQSVREIVPTDDIYDETFWMELSQGSGSMIGFMLTGYVGKALGIPAAIAPATLGALAGGAQQVQDAEQFRATGITKLASFIMGAGLGATEAIPIDRMLFRADQMTGGLVARMLHNTAAGSLEEFIQELSQSIGHDVIAQLYDESREINWAEAGRNALVGATLGGGMGAATTLLAETNIPVSGAGARAGRQREPELAPDQQEAIADLAMDEAQTRFDAIAEQMEMEGVTVLPEIIVDGEPDVDVDAPPAAGGVDADAEATSVPSAAGDLSASSAPAAPIQEVADRLVELSRSEIRPPHQVADDFVRALDRPPLFEYETVESTGGTVPAPDADGYITLSHFASQPRETLDPAQMGTGPVRGQERQRLFGDDAVPRTYYGVYSGDQFVPESMSVRDYVRLSPEERRAATRLGSIGVNANQIKSSLERRFFEELRRRGYANDEGLGGIRHEVRVRPEELYNANQDPLNLRSQLPDDMPAPSRVTRYERLVRDAGFRGMYFDSSELGQTAILFDARTPDRIVDQRYGRPIDELARPEEFGPDMTPDVFQRGGWGVVTATREAEGSGTDEVNVKANERLRRRLQRNKIPFKEVQGSYQGVPQGVSFLVFAPEDQIRKLGEDFGQESILTNRGLEYMDGRITPVVPEQTVVGDAARELDFYSELPDGTAFSLGLDFDATTEPETDDVSGFDPDDMLGARAPTPEHVEKLMDRVPGFKAVVGFLTEDELANLRANSAQKIVDMFTNLPPAEEMASVAIAGRAKRGWYQRSAEALVEIFGVEDAPRFAALLAALSPQTSVESNAINALNVWTAWIKAGRPTDERRIRSILNFNVQGGGRNDGKSAVLPAWIPNSLRALQAEDPTTVKLSGPKVDSFMLNLRGVTNEVTNDTWMANYAFISQSVFAGVGSPVKGKGPGYKAFSAAVRNAAEVASDITGETWTPAEVQETVWSWAKAVYENASNEVNAEQLLELGRVTDDMIAATPDFATLFSDGVYRNILEQGGYDLGNLETSAGSRQADAGNAGRSIFEAPEGAAIDGGAYERHLRNAARRLDALRRDRAGDTGTVVEEEVDDGFQRPEALEGFTDQELDDFYGARQPVRDDGLPLFPERTDQSFDRWFEGSKVVDHRGDPLVVYHGTPTPGFRQFDPNTTGVTSVLFSEIATHRQGFFFAENEQFAQGFADQARGKQRGEVMPVFLSIKNPFDASETLNSTIEAAREIAARAAEIDPENITNPEWFVDRVGRDDFWEALDTNEGGDVFVQAMRDLGYDGVRMVEPNHDTGESETVWVAFDPTQIKSAAENTGAYSPSDPDIYAATSSTRGAYRAELSRPKSGVAGEATAEKAELRLSRIAEDLIRLMDLTVRTGRFTLRGANIMGQYSRRSGTIRLRTQNDLTTLVHEAGHDLQANATGELAAFIKKNEGPLIMAARNLYGGDVANMKRSEQIAEGFAEFFRIFVLNRAYTAKNYNPLYTEFTDILTREQPTLLAGLDAIGDAYMAWLQLPSAQLLRNMVVSGARPSGVDEALEELREQGFGTWYNEYVRRASSSFINKFTHFNKLVADVLNVAEETLGQPLDLKAAEDPRKLIRMATNSGNRAMVQLTDGVMGYRSTKPMTRSLREALLRMHGLDPDANLSAIDPERKQDFAAYLIALRALDEDRRWREGLLERRPINATLGDIRNAIKEMEAKYGNDFIEAAAIVHEYGTGLWQKMYDAGLLAKETYQDGLTRKFYVPLQRDMTRDVSSAGISASAVGQGSSPVKRFRGSDRDIIDPMDALMQKTIALEKVIAENETKKALAALADRAGQAGALVERIPAHKLLGTSYSVKDIARQLTKDDTLSDTDAQDLMTILEASIEEGNRIAMFQSQKASARGENIVFFWENGKLAALQINDGDIGADIINTLNGVGVESMPILTDLVAYTSGLFRAAITSWPDFLLVNFIRDQVSAWILTDVGYKPFVTGLRGVGDELRQTEWARQYNAAMGIMGGMNSVNLHKARIDRDINALRSKGYFVRAFDSGGNRITNAITGLARVTELTETGTRLGIFRKTYDKAKADGLTDWEASIEAAYNATDYIDFGLHGSRMMAYRRLIPFLNAQLQGLAKMMRTLGGDEVRQRKGLTFALKAFFKDVNNLPLSRTEKNAIRTGRKAWLKMASLGLIGAALYAAFADDPDYQDASEYMRATGWVIPLGNGRIAYIPKPFELAIVSNFVERGLEWASGDKEAKNRLLRAMAMNLAPPTAPPAVMVGIEQTANYSFFGGREIVPDYMRALSPELQYNHTTSAFAKQIGELMGWSPMRVDHVLSSMGASAYRDLTSMYNTLDPNRPNSNVTDWPVTRRFVRDARRGSTSAQDFWKQASQTDGKLRRAEVTYKEYMRAGKPQAADEFLRSIPEDQRAYAILHAEFKAEAKRLHPMYRVRQLNTITSAMRREMVSELGIENSSPFGQPIKLSASTKAEVQNLLSEYSRREIRNTLIYMKEPGWAGKEPLPVEPLVDLLYETSPEFAEEFQRRVTKAKIYNADVVQQYWPEVRDRVLMDGKDAILVDILAIAKATAQ